MRFSAIVTRIALTLSALLIAAPVFAYDPDYRPATDSIEHTATAEHEVAGESEKFQPGEMIVEHISDAHEWHLWGHSHIPLPIILKTDKGFEFFSSNRFRDNEHHELGVAKGTHYDYKLLDNKVVVWDSLVNKVDETATATLYDFSITKNVLTMFIVIAIMLLIFLNIAKSYTKRQGQAPKGMQSFFEPLIVFVRDEVAKASIGPKYERFMPYLLTVFFFVWIANMLGLVPVFPGGANLTGNITITMVLAVITFLITTFNGNAHYWRHIFAMPGVPVGVLVILTPIEILSMFLRPFVLMIRLFANITAGHIIALAFFSMIFIFSKNPQTGADQPVLGWGVGIFSTLFVVFMTFLELLVAFLQAYVFTLLSAIYIGSAVEEHHHEEHAEEHGAVAHAAH